MQYCFTLLYMLKVSDVEPPKTTFVSRSRDRCQEVLSVLGEVIVPQWVATAHLKADYLQNERDVRKTAVIVFELNRLQMDIVALPDT